VLKATDPPAILSESEIEVTVEPPGPFVFVPDVVLQAVGNAGLHASLSTLQVGLAVSCLHLLKVCNFVRSYKSSR